MPLTIWGGNMGLIAAAFAEDDGIAEDGVKKAIELLRREIGELCERAEALELQRVMRHLDEAFKICC